MHDAGALAALPVWRADRLLHGVVRGQRWVHNPGVADALVLLSKGAAAVLDCADGRTLGEISAGLAQTDLGRDRLLAEAPLLLRNGLLRTPRESGAVVAALAATTAAGPTRPPERVFDLWLHVTNDCNLDCPYCYIGKGPQHLDAAVAERALGAIEMAAAAGHVDRVHVRYAGGEPMLRYRALRAFHEEATARCARNGVRYSAAILTNGTVVPEDAPAWVRDEGLGVSISIDGLGAVQDAMRPTRAGRGSADHLRRGLDRWQQAGIRPYVLVTAGDSNLAGLPELVSWLLQRQLGFRISLVRDLEWGAGTLDDRHGAQRRLRAAPDAPYDADGVLAGEALQRVRGVMMTCYDHIEASVAAAVDAGRAPLPSFRATHRFCDLSPFRPIRKACGAGSSYAAIGQDGHISPCQAALHHPEDRVALRGDRSIVEQGRQHRPFGSFERTAGNAACNACRHQQSCAAGCPLLLARRDGHIDGRSPYCEVFRAVIPRIIGIAALELWGQARHRGTEIRQAEAA
ncbi:MAG: radical SAM protein [Deltaproteobacteria bacterium]|nr:radical SAM protein [Deltaproteobacteria bacterium]